MDQPRKEWELRYAIEAGPESAEVVWMLDRVEVRRGDFELGPIDLTIARGDRLLLTGDNGTGKTTLLAAMLEQLPLTAGRVSLGSRVQIGVIDQDRSLLDSSTSRGRARASRAR